MIVLGRQAWPLAVSSMHSTGQQLIIDARIYCALDSILSVHVCPPGVIIFQIIFQIPFVSHRVAMSVAISMHD